MVNRAYQSIIISVLSFLIITSTSQPLSAQDYFKRNISIGHFNDGVKLERESDLAGATAAYERAIDADPSNPFPYLNLGSIQYKQEDYLLSKYYYLMSFKNDPYYASAKGNLEVCERKLSALSSKEIEERARNSFSKGQSLYAEGKFSEASMEFMRYTGAYPDRGDGYLHIGKSLFGCKRYGAAERNLSLAAQFSELSAELTMLTAQACEGNGEIKKALGMYRFALSQDENATGREKGKGSAEERRKSLSEKIAVLEKQIEQVQAKARKFEKELSEYVESLSEKGKIDLREFLFNRISEGVDEKYIKEELLKALKMSLSGLNFDNGLIKASLPPGWYRVTEETKAGSPFALFRKWPGDSQLALYSVQSSGSGFDAAAETARKIASAEGQEIKINLLAGGFSNAEKTAWFDAPYAFEEAGFERLRWWVFYLEGNKSFCLALALPGYAGLSTNERERSLSETESILSHAIFAKEIWKNETGIAYSQRLHFSFPPDFAGTPPVTEKNMPWRVVHGQGFTILVPPGIIGKKIDESYPDRARNSMVMWLRGEFTDTAGMAVKIGDEQFPGYIDILEFETKEKSRDYSLGKPSLSAPAPDPGSALLKSEDFTVVAHEMTGAETSSVGKYQGKAFPGKWLVFRMSYETRVVEFGFPVLKGEDSISLFWMPTTFRIEGMPPAFPPVDAAEKFKITFKRAAFSETKGPLGKEGEVFTPDFRIEVPSGWRVSINYRSIDGYPVSLKEEKGNSLMKIFKIEQGRDISFAKRRAQEMLCGNCELEWAALEKPKNKEAKNALQATFNKNGDDASESRMAQIYETTEGTIFLFFFIMPDEGLSSYSGQSIKRALSSLYFE